MNFIQGHSVTETYSSFMFIELNISSYIVVIFAYVVIVIFLEIQFVDLFLCIFNYMLNISIEKFSKPNSFICVFVNEFLQFVF